MPLGQNFMLLASIYAVKKLSPYEDSILKYYYTGKFLNFS